ncbi:hypothetical protein U9M48_001875, partial [Paspalum notatum var. saurae]
FLIHICCSRAQGDPVAGGAGGDATPCVAALPPGSHKCAGGWRPHARCARVRVRVLASLLPRTSSPLPQSAVVPCSSCPCASGHPPSAVAEPPPAAADRLPGRGSRSVEAEE